MTRRIAYGSLVLGLAAVAVLLAGCKQTRPVPRYEPMLSLAANQVTPTDVYRPAWAGAKPAMPAPRKGGG